MQKELTFFTNLVNKLLTEEANVPVVKPTSTETVFSDLNLFLEDEGMSEKDWEKVMEDLVLNTPRTSTKLFFNQLFGGRNAKAVTGDLLAVMLNNSMYTYKVAGPQVGVEKAILSKVTERVGYEKGYGTIASGGSMCNLMAMTMARDKMMPESRDLGLQRGLISYTSAESHYSIPKNAQLLGLGRGQVRLIESLPDGRMNPQRLREAIQKDKNEGLIPFFVNATSGTTVLGAFDDLTEIAAICKQDNLWLHVDGAYCGGVIFSEKYKSLVKGIELSDSFSFNAHKMMMTPLTCSIIITKHKESLYNSFSNDAEYLYQTDADDFNLGKTSLQCGRRNDALKFWSLWKAVGTNGLAEMVEKQFYLADVAREYIHNHPDYTHCGIDNSISVCFNYKNMNAADLCTRLYEKAATLVGYGQFKDLEFIRLITINATNSKQDILNFFAVLEANAEE